LETLYCYDCSSLTEIPNIIGLLRLNCANCPLIQKIPNISYLQTLVCFNCPLLTEIPDIFDLIDLGLNNINTEDNFNITFINEKHLSLISEKTKQAIDKNFSEYKKRLSKMCTLILLEELSTITGHPEWSLNWYFSERKKKKLVNECNFKQLKNGKIVV
jgi:hypothetical protein